jgi:RNA polymerase sigma factor for flagellar operon FliA
MHSQAALALDTFAPEEARSGVQSVSPMPSADELRTYMPLVQQTVLRMMSRLPPNVLKEDLIAAGTYGLLNALRRSEDRGAAFEWYARIRIRGAVVDELRAQDWLSRRARARRASVAGSDPRAIVGFDDLPEQGQDLEGTDPVNADELVDAHRSWLAVHAAIDALPARERRLIQMHYLQGLPLKDVATEFGVSEPRVSQLHARAMTMLRNECLAVA